MVSCDVPAVACQNTVKKQNYLCMPVPVRACACACVCIVGANRFLLSDSQLCPTDESQEAPACVYGYYVEAPA